jgi:RNA-directed DNA polymerase
MRRSEAKDEVMVREDYQTPNKVRKLQITLYRKAKAEPKYRFWSLYGEVQRKDVLEAAFEAVSENDGAPGVDGESLESISKTAEGRESWIEALHLELKLVLMPIWEADFHEQSYGFRPKRQAHQAMDAIKSAVRSGREKRYRVSPVRRVWIDKRNGEKRPLGIPTVKDRVVQLLPVCRRL